MRCAAAAPAHRCARLFPAVTCSAQATYMTGRAASRARHRRQRLVLPRSRRGDVLAPAGSARCAARRCGTTARRRDPSFTCAKMFWWFNMYGARRLVGHAAAHLSGRRAQDSGDLLVAVRSRRAPGRRARAVSLLRFLGPEVRHPIERMDRRRLAEGGRVARAVAADGLSAAPRLRPAAVRRQRPAGARADRGPSIASPAA